jgi:succinate dehydrogenase / fumarate reductase flavoprotein subunit
MSRTEEGLKKAIGIINDLEDDFWKNVRVTGTADEYNKELEKVWRVADFFELGRLMCEDALDRNESCGGHFREEYQTEDGEAKRDDVNFAHVSAWEYQGAKKPAKLHKEVLNFEYCKPTLRSYK